MEKIIIHSGAKNGRYTELVRSSGKDITIGRAYRNTLVLPDEYVAPDQIRLSRRISVNKEHSHQWFAEILDETNSVLLNGTPVEETLIPVASGDRLTLGRTSLSLFDQDHEVAPTKQLLTRYLHQDSVGWLIPLLALVFASLWDTAMDHWLYFTVQDLTSYGETVLSTAGLLLGWSAFWALVGRLLRHQSHFGQQLLATSLVLFLATLTTPLPEIIEFAFNSLLVGYIAKYSISFALIALLLKFHLMLATNIHRTTLISVLTSGFIMGSYALSEHYDDDSPWHSYYSDSLQPSLLQISPRVSSDEFLEIINGQFDLLDEDAEQSDQN